MKNFLRLRFNILMIAVVIACQSAGQSTDNSMLKPGDSIHGMTLTKGTAKAASLWAFCSSPQQNERMIIAECHIPLSTKLGIGQVFHPMDNALTDLEGSEFTWDLSIDGRSLDLDAFGTYDYVLPNMPPPPCPIREVFTRFTAWDVVLADLTPGSHILHSILQTDTETYTRTVFLTIKQPL